MIELLEPGAFGRIDVSGPNGKARLLLLNNNNDVPPKERRAHVAWYIGPSEQQNARLLRARPEFNPLTQESFQQLFSDLFGISA